MKLCKSEGRMVGCSFGHEPFKLRMEAGTEANLKPQNSWISITKVEKNLPYAVHVTAYN
jgi:hypothetical protein